MSGHFYLCFSFCPLSFPVLHPLFSTSAWEAVLLKPHCESWSPRDLWTADSESLEWGTPGSAATSLRGPLREVLRPRLWASVGLGQPWPGCKLGCRPTQASGSKRPIELTLAWGDPKVSTLKDRAAICSVPLSIWSSNVTRLWSRAFSVPHHPHRANPVAVTASEVLASWAFLQL